MNVTGLVNILVLLLAFHCLQVVAHSVHYLYTMLKPQLGFAEFTAVGLLDGEQFMSYNSSNMKLISEDWIKKIEHEDLWKSMEQDIQGHHDGLKNIIKILLRHFNHITDIHTLQRMYGCEVDDDGTTRGYDRYGYNGDDLMTLELKTGTWTAANNKAEIIAKMWDPNNSQAKGWKNFLENECNEHLKKYMSYGRKTVERKVRPIVSMLQKYSSPEVVCHAVGFFPNALDISWKKDGHDIYKDLEETLPNQDGTYQKRSILKVSAEDLQKHNYTCVIQHSSLEKDLVLPVSERRILRVGRSNGGSVRGLIGILVMNPIAIVVGIIVGIVVWKKFLSHRFPCCWTTMKNTGEWRKEANVNISKNRFMLFNS